MTRAQFEKALEIDNKIDELKLRKEKLVEAIRNAFNSSISSLATGNDQDYVLLKERVFREIYNVFGEKLRVLEEQLTKI